jgi:hypothetical protein
MVDPQTWARTQLAPLLKMAAGTVLSRDLKVQPDRPIVDVCLVYLHPLLEGKFIAPADLPEAGDAGLDRDAAAVEPIVAIDLGEKWGAVDRPSSSGHAGRLVLL